MIRSLKQLNDEWEGVALFLLKIGWKTDDLPSLKKIWVDLQKFLDKERKRKFGNSQDDINKFVSA